MTEIKLKRAYEAASNDDGYRVYIDRLWPRGMSHETFHYDAWDKDLAPGDDLRHWFHDNPDSRWEDFETKYQAELKANPAWPRFMAALASHPTVTLLYSSHDEHQNNAVVLAKALISASPRQFKSSSD